MNDNMVNEIELQDTFNKGFEKLKETFYRNHHFEERDEDIFPPFLARRDMIESLPPLIQVIELLGPIGHEKLKNGKGFMIKFDFDEENSKKLEFCGSIDHLDSKELINLLVEKFHLKKDIVENFALDTCTHFQNSAMWLPDENWYLSFIPDDILINPQALDDELRHYFLLFPDIPILSEKFKRDFHEDYNSLYNLSSDPILNLNEIIKPDKTGSYFNVDIENVQQRISKLQLIPLVPDEIKTVFKRAKDLFVFGYFRYEFFTISQHYAYLTLEAAIKTRYMKSFGKEISLTDIRKKELKKKIRSTTFHAIEEFCMKNKGWNVHSLLIDNKPFPYNGKKLLEWLENEHLVRKWERGSYEASLFLRHSHSHLERPMTDFPHSDSLERVCERVNFLFHSLRKE